MIRGDINNLIKWLDLNEIDTWTVSTSRSKQDNQIVFERKESEPRDASIARMIEVLNLSDNTILYIQGRLAGQKGYVGLYNETWCNKHEDTNAVPMGAVPAPQSIDSHSVQEMINNAVATAVEHERMIWKQQDLERREKELKDELREFKKHEMSAIGTAIKMAGPFLQPIMQAFAPKTANVAIGNVPETVADNPPATEIPDVTQPDDELSADEIELNEALNRFAEFDPDYAKVLIKLINACTSGKEVSLMGGVVKLDYNTLKQYIMEL